MKERDEKTASTVKGNKLWDKVKDSRVFASLLSVVALVFVGFMANEGKKWVGEREAESRTFDLLSSREIAANELQAKVFDVFVQHVVPALEEEGNDYKKVALLAGLHSNFSEFFDTRPVFEAFAEKVKKPTARHELTRLAKRVARRQANFIKAHADPTNENTKSREITLYPGVDYPIKLAIHDGPLRIKGEVRRHYKIADAREHIKDKPALGDDDDDYIDDVSDFVTIEMELTGIDKLTFELSYMDTPYMDNIWMLHSDGSHHQLALRLLDIDTKNEEHTVKIELLHFPGDVYAATQRLPVEELLKGGHKHKH